LLRDFSAPILAAGFVQSAAQTGLSEDGSSHTRRKAEIVQHPCCRGQCCVHLCLLRSFNDRRLRGWPRIASVDLLAVCIYRAHREVRKSILLLSGAASSILSTRCIRKSASGAEGRVAERHWLDWNRSPLR